MNGLIARLTKMGLKTRPITDNRTGRLQGIATIGSTTREAIEGALREHYESTGGKVRAGNGNSADFAVEGKGGTTYASIDHHPEMSIITFSDSARLY